MSRTTPTLPPVSSKKLVAALQRTKVTEARMQQLLDYALAAQKAFQRAATK